MRKEDKAQCDPYKERKVDFLSKIAFRTSNPYNHKEYIHNEYLKSEEFNKLMKLSLHMLSLLRSNKITDEKLERLLVNKQQCQYCSGWTEVERGYWMDHDSYCKFCGRDPENMVDVKNFELAKSIHEWTCECGKVSSTAFSMCHHCKKMKPESEDPYRGKDWS